MEDIKSKFKVFKLEDYKPKKKRKLIKKEKSETPKDENYIPSRVDHVDELDYIAD